MGADPASAAQALAAGGLVILPTETVYGLAADASNPQAVARVFEAKGRPRFNPLIVHVADLAAAQALVELDERALVLARVFWPGPLAVVAPLRPGAPVCDLARAGLDTLAVRVPDHPAALAVLKAFGGPVAAPSANRSGRPSPTAFADAVEETGSAAAAAVDGGPCRVGLESAVVACVDGTVRLLRPGAATRAEIEAVAGPIQAEAAGDAARSPGRLARHYAPEAPVRLDRAGPEPGEAYLAFGSYPDGPGVFHLSRTGDLREAAANLFSALRAADRTAPAAIAVAPIPGEGLGEAINDRLRRSAGFVG